MPHKRPHIIDYIDRRPLRCRWGIHKWRFSHGTGHQYYECTRCGKRVIKMLLEGYQPVDYAWLERQERKE